MRTAVAALAAAAVAIALAFGFFEARRREHVAPAAPTPRPTVARSESEPVPEVFSATRTGELRLGPAGSGRPGLVGLDTSAFSFDVGSDGYSSVGSGNEIEITDLQITNRTERPVFGVTLFVRGSSADPPKESRVPIGDIDALATAKIGSARFPAPDAGASADGAPDLRLYVAFRVASDEPTWQITPLVPLRLDGFVESRRR